MLLFSHVFVYSYSRRTPKERVESHFPREEMKGNRFKDFLRVINFYLFLIPFHLFTHTQLSPEFMSRKKCFSLSLWYHIKIRTKLCDCVSIFSMIPTHHHTLTLSPYPQQTHWPKFDPKKAAKNGCFYVEIIDKQMNIIGPCNRFQLFFLSCFELQNLKERKFLMHAQKPKMIRWFVGFPLHILRGHAHRKNDVNRKTFSYFTSHNFSRLWVNGKMFYVVHHVGQALHVVTQ